MLAQGLGDFARGNIRSRLPAPERRLGRLVPTVDLHARRSQPVEAVPFELPFPGTNFLDRQGTALAGLVERQSAAVQRFHYGGLPPSIAG